MTKIIEIIPTIIYNYKVFVSYPQALPLPSLCFAIKMQMETSCKISTSSVDKTKDNSNMKNANNWQKLTHQRTLILEYIQSSKSHPSAEIIFNELKPQLPRLSLSTIYRNLASLEKDPSWQPVPAN